MNLDRLKEAIEKIPFTMLLVLFSGYLAFDYYNFNNDPGSELNMKKTELKASRDELEKLARKVEQTKEFMKSLSVKRDELRRLTQDLEDTRAVLTENLDVPAFMKLVLTEAQRVGLSVQSIKPGEVTRGEYYAQQVFDMNFRGVYVQLIGFLDRLSNLQKIVRVDDFLMKPVSASTARHVELEGTLQLKAYRYVASKADELVQKEASATGAAKPGTPPVEKKVSP